MINESEAQSENTSGEDVSGDDGSKEATARNNEITFEAATAGPVAEEDFRTILNREFARRIRVNPRYSLRAFAKSLGIYHATLSALLAGSRPFTPRSIRTLASALGASPRQTEQYVDTFIRQRGGVRSTAETATSERYLDLAEDAFALMSQWEHDAVLEALHLPHVKGDAKSVAAELGIPAALVHASLQTLARSGLVELVPETNEFRTTTRNTTQILTPNQTSTARREYQKALLHKSIEAIDSVAVELRDHSSMTLTIDRRDLEKLKGMIKKFRRDLTAFAQRRSATPESVYQLQISLFPLSHKTPTEEN